MRTYIDFANGVVSISQMGSASGAATNITPPLESLIDLSDFGVLDLEIRLLSLEIIDADPGDAVILHLETSMQNTEDAPAYWVAPGELEDGLDLVGLTAPAVMSTSISRGVLRYFRWRLSIPPHASAPAVEVKLVFQLRGYGRTS